MTNHLILIADDDMAFTSAIATRLESAGHSVIAAHDAERAASIARCANPDLVILDINMPPGDGFGAHEHILADPDIADTPVIYVTGERSTKASYGSTELGAFALLYKPIETHVLLEQVSDALTRTPIRADPTEPQPAE